MVWLVGITTPLKNDGVSEFVSWEYDSQLIWKVKKCILTTVNHY